MKGNRTAQSLSGSIFIALLFSATGCLLAVPLAIRYYQSTRDTWQRPMSL
jgi:hypothetical protein